MKKILAFILLLLSICQYAYPREINIAVQIACGVESTQKDWNDFTNFLHQKIPEHTFRVDLIPPKQLKNPDIQKKYEYIIANPELYIYLEQTAGAMRIATMTYKDREQHLEHAKYGGVIFTKSNRNDINDPKDIKGKKIVSPNSVGIAAYLLQLDTLGSVGVKINKSEIIFLETAHNAVVQAVVDGQYDVGFVRSGIIEKMVEAGKISLSQVKIINPSMSPELMEAVSTKLVPEWPIMAMSNSDSELSEEICSALVMADKGRQHGSVNPIVLNWTIPQDYSYVSSLLKKYRVAPFDATDIAAEDVLQAYWIQATIVMLLILTMLATMLFYMKLSLDKRKKLEEELVEHQQNLEKAVDDRTAQLELAKISIDNSSDGIFWIRPNSNIINVNNAGCNMLGYTKKELCTMNVPDLDTMVTYELWLEELDSLRNDKSMVFETKLIKKDGSLINVSVVSNLIEFQGQEYIFASIRDVLQQNNKARELELSATCQK